MRILAVDDEFSMRLLIKTLCNQEGWECTTCENGNQALDAFAEQRPDIVLLDVMMPCLDGFQVCRLIREKDSTVPVMFLSAKGEIGDKKTAFSYGGDDYLVKPFNEEELLIRIKALVRRSRRTQYEGSELDAHADQPQTLRVGPFEFNLAAHRAIKDGVPLALTPKEYALLFFLAQHEGIVMSKEELIEELWGSEYLDGAISIAVYIRRLRKKIEDDSAHPCFLKTVWAMGYIFETQ